MVHISESTSHFRRLLTSRILRAKVGLRIAFGRRRKAALVTNEKVIHANILMELSRVIKVDGLATEFNLNDLVDRIVQKVLDAANPRPTLRDRMNVEPDGLTRAGLYRFAQVCGLIGHWELNLRIFAARMDVDVRRPAEERGKRNAHLVDYADLSDVIAALSPKISSLDLELARLNRLRNAFVHGNFQAARELVIARLTKREKEKFKGQVIVMNLECSFAIYLTSALRNLTTTERSDA